MEVVLERAADRLDALVAELDVRIVYVDLDGTLLGPGGSLFASPEGGVTPEAAAAVAALGQAGIDLVPMSGRTRDQVREAARTLGGPAYIAEIGGLVVYRDGPEERVVRAPGTARGRGTAYEALVRSGVGGFLLDAYRGRLEPHAPWALLERECSMLFRGQVDLVRARALLEESGYVWVDLLDNGAIANAAARFPHLEVSEVHAYHLVPRGVSKRSAIAVDRRERGLAREQCIAVGDSSSDAETAPEVGAVFIVSNADATLGTTTNGAAGEGNVYRMDRSHGLGFADAVLPFARGRPSGPSRP